VSSPQYILLGNQIKEDVIGRACGTNRVKRNSLQYNCLIS